ncbi:MAG: peptidylprolyl isomerase [Planctomycetota bacterium]
MKAMLPWIVASLLIAAGACKNLEPIDDGTPQSGERRPVGLDSGLVARLVFEGAAHPAVGATLPVRLIIENTGNRKVAIDANDLHTRHLKLSGTAAAGSYRTDDRLGYGEVTLFPGMSVDREFDLARFFGNLRPGRLEVRWSSDRLVSDPLAIDLTEDYSKLRVRMETSMGDVVLQLLPQQAPVTVAKFVESARDGLYENTVFHRVINGFVVQGGDPSGTGEGHGVDFTLPPEFGEQPFVTGTVGVARTSDPLLNTPQATELIEQGAKIEERDAYLSSGASQFFFCLTPQEHLQGRYTAFAQVIDGLDVLQRIGEVETTGSGPGVTRPNRPVQDVLLRHVEVFEAPGQ